MRQINKRRLLEYLIYWEIKEIQYQFSFDSDENWLDEEFKIDLLEDLNEVAYSQVFILYWRCWFSTNKI